MRRLSVFVLALAAASLVCASADARPRHRHHARVAHANEIIVKKRSFLDSGRVVPVGSENRYMSEATRYNYEPRGGYRSDQSQESWLPGPFDLLPGFSRR